MQRLLIILALLPLTGCTTLASFINLPASQFQVSTIQFCAQSAPVLAKHPANAKLAAALQTLCAAPPGLAPTRAQTAALSTALQQLASG